MLCAGWWTARPFGWKPTSPTARDQYKRLLAYVYVGDLFVNAEMIRQGQAVLYTVPPNVAHVEEYRKTQQEARKPDVESGIGGSR